MTCHDAPPRGEAKSEAFSAGFTSSPWPALDTQLRAVIEAWPGLSKTTRKAILRTLANDRLDAAARLDDGTTE